MTIELRKPGQLDKPEAAHAPTIRVRARQLVVGRRIAVVAVTRKRAYVAWQVGKQLPGIAVPFLFWWSFRGAWRATTLLIRYAMDTDSAMLRAQHAATKEGSAEYRAVSAVRSRNLAARVRMLAAGAVLVLVLPMAWWAPDVLAWTSAAAVFVAALKLLPLAQWHEVIVAAVAAVLAYIAIRIGAPLVPHPPTWMLATAAAGIVAGLGYAGRPISKPLIRGLDLVRGGRVPPLTAPMVTAALCLLGNPKMKEPESVGLLSDPIRCGEGYQIDLELPRGVPAAFVVGRREEFASGIRRELGCVFLSVGRRHPGHLVVYVGDQPMALQEQAPWPLRKGPKVDIFNPLPLVTNQRGEWVNVTLAYASMVIGAVPRMGKTFLLRQVMLMCALDPRVRIIALDGKGTGDLGCIEDIAEFYCRGVNPEKIERVLEMVRGLRRELQERGDFLDSLSEDECPENKITSELATKYPKQLSPVALFMDETQSYFDYGEKKNKEHAAIRDELSAGLTELAKLGPALGIFEALATQNVNTTTVPRGISTNIVIRAALKLFDQIGNDQILGTGAYKRGVDATQLDFFDKGVLILAADGGRPEVTRGVAGLDAPTAKRLATLAAAHRGLDEVSDDVEDAEVVADIAADVRTVLAERSRHSAHHVELIEWLCERWPNQYPGLTVDELSARLRAQGVAVGQVWSNNRNAKGVDLRKQGSADVA